MSDGIAEELLNLLAKIPELRVISRSSPFAFKGEKIDIPYHKEKNLPGSFLHLGGNHPSAFTLLFELLFDVAIAFSISVLT